MKTRNIATLVLLAAWLAQPIAAAEFVVVAVTGVLEPEGLQEGQELNENTTFSLEPWGRALIRETTECGMTHVVVGLSDYVLTLADDCSATDEPMNVAARVQRGESFAERLKETGSGPSDELVSALRNEPCVFMQQLSEEGENRRLCPSGHALRGVRCDGEYCDNKDLLCCPYLEGAADPSSKQINSKWISEEYPNNTVQSRKFLYGLTCKGYFCDEVLPHQFRSTRLVNSRECGWTGWASERPGGWLDCALGAFAAGMRCRGDYCADVGLYCCKAQVE